MAKSVVHFEIGCRNSEKTSEFYAELFDWSIGQMGLAGTIATTVRLGRMDARLLRVEDALGRRMGNPKV